MAPRQKLTHLGGGQQFVLHNSMSTSLSDNALVVLRKRGYLRQKSTSGVTSWETPDEMFRRVAKLIAGADEAYGATVADIKKTADEFYRAMVNLEYLSGSVLLNAARERKQFSACYVLPLTDSIEDIYDQLRNAALILRTGGGIGIPLSNLRPRNSHVGGTQGISSGAVSFLRLFNFSAATIAEESARRPAMMGVLQVDHPDIVEFIMAKEDPSTLYHFNVSVGATNAFMDRVKRGRGTVHLFHPNDGETERDMDVMELWNLIATQAWKVGDPGLVFLDHMNNTCPTPTLGKYETTNPCGEQPLLPYESCNLGNINLGKFVEEGMKEKIDWQRLEEIVRLGVHFQDNVVDLCEYPIPELRTMAHTTRKIGLGVMGWADMLVKLGIRYDSAQALKMAEKIAKFIQETAREESVELAKKRGSFPSFEESMWKKKGFSHMRNSTVNTIAPTGTISIIAGCSSGIEPLFALAYRRENILDLGKTSFVEVNTEFEKQLKTQSSKLKSKSQFENFMQRISETGSCQDILELSQHMKDIFRVSMEIPYQWHIKMQAVWQKFTDSAVSKTINLPNDATVEDIKNAYLLAYETGCKGITVYRDGCRGEQVLNVGGGQQGMRDKGQRIRGEECPECQSELQLSEGCATCPKCGWSKCAV